MQKPGYEDLQETTLRGPRGSSATIKVGEEFGWINPELEYGTVKAALKRMIKNYGHGPFVLKKITRVPAGYIMFTFDDQHGDEQRITRDYFTAWE